MQFTEKEILDTLNFNKIRGDKKAIEKALIEYYSKYLSYVIDTKADAYNVCDNLFGTNSVSSISEKTEINTIITYKEKDYKVLIISYIGCESGGAEETDYLYQIEVTNY